MPYNKTLTTMKHKIITVGNDYVGPHYYCVVCKHFISTPIEALEECKKVKRVAKKRSS